MNNLENLVENLEHTPETNLNHMLTYSNSTKRMLIISIVSYVVITYVSTYFIK